MATYHDFTAADWARIERDWTAWWEGRLERPLVYIEAYEQPRQWENFEEFLTSFPFNTPIEPVLDHFQPWLDARHCLGDAYPRWWVNFGAGIMAAFFGAEVHHEAGTTWFYPLAAASIADIRLQYQPDNPWWQRVLTFTRHAVERWGRQITIGHTDLGGNLDIIASLRGTQQLLLDLYDAPAEVDRLAREITPIWLRCYNELDAIIAPAGRGRACWSPHWFPGQGYMLQSDFAYMISPAMFARFVLPDLQACCQAHDYAFYHLDGVGQLPHLDQLLSLPRLRGIQWQPGDGKPRADEWLPILKRIRDADKLCQVYVTRAGALKIIRELGGRGFLFDIALERLTPRAAEDFLEQVARLA